MREASPAGARTDEVRLALAGGLMDDFAEETGVEGDRPPRRYLWTDAFAVTNELSLHRRSGDRRHLERALALVDQVHHVLGRHRPDDERSGWISRLEGEQAELHPTAGGLRIGKPLPERGSHDPPDPRLEWERDGQYYHYLTRWMHALLRSSEVTGEGRFLEWGVELARVAQAAFLRPGAAGAPGRLVWKTSIDLSRPLVDAMGHHDPLDGLLTLASLREAERARRDGQEPSVLDGDLAVLQAMCEGRSWASDDPLGVGGLLVDLYRLAGLVVRRQLPDSGLLEEVAGDAAGSLAAVARGGSLALPPSHRLPFRELGLAIGLAAMEELRTRSEELSGKARTHLEGILEQAWLRAEIEGTWLEPRARVVPSWTEHLDINRVMLATALAPDDYLGLERA